MPRSMTGFSRLEEQFSMGQLICEVRTVNHRFLEPNLRLSDSFRSLEPFLRDGLRKKLGRGKVDLVLAVRVDEAQGASADFNQDLAQSIVNLTDEIVQLGVNTSPINPLELLRWPGVLRDKEIDQKALEQQAKMLFQKTLEQLIANREREGAELSAFIEQRLQGISASVEQLKKRLPQLAAAQEEKLRAKLEALKVDVDEERLAQEIVYLAQKADVAEELDRLEAHITEVRRTLKQKEPIGRRLDFLMQELNREANTLSSKSTASDTTQSAVDLKVLIEQMREQIQNIE